MIDGLINRMAPLPVARRARRTPAQQEASRRNGAQSRGPLTPEGKARSRLNALKHGLLARVITPPADPRGHDRRYSQIRRELVREFQPATFSAIALVDALAYDYLQLSRCCAMEESVQQPSTIPQDYLDKWDSMQDNIRWAGLADQAVACLGRRGAPTCEVADAQKLARHVALFVEQLEEDHRQEQADAEEVDERAEPAQARPARPAGDLAFEAEENRHFEELVRGVLPAKDRLTDMDHITAVLSGQRRAKAIELAPLRMVLQDIARNARLHAAGHQELQRNLDERCSLSVQTLADAPNRLLILDRYRARIERSIERKLRQLDANRQQ